jgi:hypothetical protein
MSPITSIVESFSVWLLAVPVIFIVFIFITWSPAATEDEKAVPFPQRVPVLDNALDIPRTLPWIKFAQWGKELGPLFKLSILHKTHIIISDEKIAQALLEDRGLYYSDRPWFNFTCGLLTGNLHLLLLSNNGSFTLFSIHNTSDLLRSFSPLPQLSTLCHVQYCCQQI